MLSKIFTISARGLCRTMPRLPRMPLMNANRFAFTSSSDPTQVALLEEV